MTKARGQRRTEAPLSRVPERPGLRVPACHVGAPHGAWEVLSTAASNSLSPPSALCPARELGGMEFEKEASVVLACTAESLRATEGGPAWEPRRQEPKALLKSENLL